MSKSGTPEQAAALYKSGRLQEAEDLCLTIVADSPSNAAAHCNLGIILHAKKSMKEAFGHLQKAHELEPENPVFCLNLANLLRDIAQYEKALLLLERAVSLKPDYAAAWLNLGAIYKDIGDAEKSTASFKRATEINPSFIEASSNYCYSLMFLPTSSPQQIYEAHVGAAKTYAPSPHKWHNVKKWRIGFVSGDFRQHPAAYFTIGTIEWLAKKGCEVFLYANQLEEDDITRRLKKAGIYRSIHNVNDQNAAKMIADDGIQILFDLTGHNARGRLGIFAQKPAPVQITWAGYMATTGLPQIDFIIGDNWHMKEGNDKFYSEKIIRLPYSFICFDTPPSHPITQSADRPITFGCFNIPVKINRDVVGVWTEILKQVPDSQLVLKAKQYSATAAKDRILRLFGEVGFVNIGRIKFMGGSSREKHLEAFNEIDISLDPFPFSGSTTTLESLWMGIPVVTMSGSTMASRHSSSYLGCLGLDELIADNKQQYIDMAVSLASNKTRIAEYRSSLRNKMMASPICDIEKFAPEFLNALKLVANSPA